MQWSVVLIKAFAGLADAEPSEKVAHMEAALAAARLLLEAQARAARWIICGVTAAFALVSLWPRREAPDPDSPREASKEWAASLTALALVFVLARASRPMRAENALPWPRSPRGDLLRAVDPPTPDVEGPDEIRRAPVVAVFEDKVLLDGYECDLPKLSADLATLNRNFTLLNEGAVTQGVVLLVGEHVSGATLRPVLRTVHDAGNTEALFAFTKLEVLHRPTFGDLSRVWSSAARATLGSREDLDASPGEAPRAPALVRFTDSEAYESLARRLVDLRRGGTEAVVDIGD
jgi:hypothetical protein